MKLILVLIVAVTIVAGQDAVARCGPWYSNQACPFNANGLGGELVCTRFGFCSSTPSDSANGVFVQIDGDCVSQADMNGYCNGQLAGATCSFAEKRCVVSGQPAKKFDGLAGGSSGTTTTTTTTTGGAGGTSTTSGSINTDNAPATSSATSYSVVALLTALAVMVAAALI